ncbi:flagellar biosynthesis protein FlgF [Rhodopseudomonas palustris]|jgi:flagellar basal-body rod protein FlgF|uniref:Flagellar biosynthesis protein FlgF n=1 Tax=Rhodopseudomonas palustris TaxID=1076 RepID=A0A323UKX2_RHOPL|nr:flagellar hook-basal body complex protein [Rhodopseudomonas palustris]PZA12857.1 flagellar biosynthesis protein FlgF [Rhodopseudomonas palustris]
MSDKEVIGLSRLIALRQQTDRMAHNIANQHTTGFKSVNLSFREYLTDAREAEDTPQHPLRSLVATVPYVDHSLGAFRTTGNAFDVAVVGDGFFVVETTAGERYTRNGAFTLDAEGRLVNQSGAIVLTTAGPLRVPRNQGQVTIGTDGTVSVDRGAIGRLRVVRFDDRSQLRADEAGLFAARSSPSELTPAQIRLAVGVLESSNVNALREMGSLISAARAYDQVANSLMSNSDPNELRKLAGQER